MAPITLAARVTLLFSETHGLEIEITDAVSGLRICELTVDGPGAIALLSRRAMVPGSVILYDTPARPLGYRVEVKTETIDCTPAKKADGYTLDPAAMAVVLAPFLVDGWTVGHRQNPDWENHHRRKAPPKGSNAILYHVSFTRWVHPTTGAPWIWPTTEPETKGPHA